MSNVIIVKSCTSVFSLHFCFLVIPYVLESTAPFNAPFNAPFTFSPKISCSY